MSKKELMRVRFDSAAPIELTPEQKRELELLAARTDDEIDTSDIPPADEAFWANAIRNPYYRPVKKQLTVRVDSDVLAWLRSAGSGYQTKLNEILRQAMLRDVKTR